MFVNAEAVDILGVATAMSVTVQTIRQCGNDESRESVKVA